MTTALDETVIVEPSGLTLVCSWCVPRARLDELNRIYRVSHGLCTTCAVKLLAQGRT
jgi:hypothetical protein